MNNNMDAINEHRQYISELRKQLDAANARIAELKQDLREQLTATGRARHSYASLSAKRDIELQMAEQQIAKRDARIAELEAGLRNIAACRCETYTSGDCVSHGGHYIDSIYTADGICDTCIANAALAGKLHELPRMFPPPVTDVTP